MMERLTEKLPDGRNIIRGHHDEIFNPKYGHFIAGEAVDKLAEYEDAEEQGLLLRLPCKKGDKVYRIWSCGANGYSLAEFEIENIDICNLPEIEFAMRSVKNKYATLSYRFFKTSDIGETIFLTREEAEAALAEKGGAE